MSCGTKKVSYKICRCACKWNCNCLIPQEKKSFPAFGSSAKRDVRIGLHPKMYKGSTIDSPAVGLYNPKFPFKCKRPSISWKRQIETKEFSLTMGGRYEGKLKEQREQLKVGRGPGTHEILQWPDDVLQKPCKTTKRNVGFGGIVPLFQPSWPSVTPGPGYSKYYPYYYIDKREREGASCVPTFEYDGLYPRSTIEVKPWSLPCILYKVKDARTLDAFLKKVVGKRGPYDLFTGWLG
ncbi:lymphocyte expansion molecule-like [Apis florea]|uniref:lymphocyte expansion molecule-like n=1 Tax=Apis florea TaxID=7463 RepID=UPI0012FE9166|nr:lymphocyte expansion molecule-like [Apis florea]